jgi:DNA-binding CsgD family transcriptional regulator
MALSTVDSGETPWLAAGSNIQVLHLGTNTEVLDALAAMIRPLQVNVDTGAIEHADLWIVADGDSGVRIAVLPCNPTRCGIGGPPPLTLTVTPISPSENRVLRCLPTHLSSTGIAKLLGLSRHTVKSHMNSIYRKLDVTSRDGAVRRARELGILDTVSYRGDAATIRHHPHQPPAVDGGDVTRRR